MTEEEKPEDLDAKYQHLWEKKDSPPPNSLTRFIPSWPICIAGVVLLITIVVLVSMGELEFRPSWPGGSSSSPSPSFVSVNGNTPRSESEAFRELVKNRVGSEGLEFTINDDLDLDSRKIIQVRFDIGDNLTDGMVKRGAMMDIEAILKAIDESGIYCGEVTVFGSFPLTDKYGGSKSEVVVKATYSGTEIDKVDWNGFLTDNVYEIADDVWMHPAFRN
ncbi:hypothetical protein [Bremerella cremea]|nr:hypothetical protein [Bremerella cremea]